MNGSNGNSSAAAAAAPIATTTATTNSVSEGKDVPVPVESVHDMLVRWKKALFTHEDYMHHHKILGILCLLSFAFRICFFFSHDMAFRLYPQLTIPTILLHLLLPISSFQFKIPKRRIRDGGRIWPQYRWHSLLFALRSVLLISLYYYEENYHLTDTPLYFMNYIIQMFIMAAVEFVNYAVGPEQHSNTIREMDTSPYVKFFLSTMQFNAHAFFFLGIRSFAVPFYALVAVQMTPFIGTLRRKMIFTSNFWGQLLYISFLLGGFVIQTYHYHLAGGEVLHLFGRSTGFVAALLRFSSIIPKPLSFIQNKFVIWTVMYLIMQYYRSINFDIDVVHLRILFGILIVLLALTAHHKVQLGYYPKDVKHAKQMKMAEKIQ
jgi:hypothetical protein